MIDISDILSDPDFQVSLTGLRRKVIVDEHGRAKTTSEKFTITACVQAAGAKELERLPEADRVREILVIYSTTRFNVSELDTNPDVIFWQDKAYEIIACESWPRWHRALAQLLPEDEIGQ